MKMLRARVWAEVSGSGRPLTEYQEAVPAAHADAYALAILAVNGYRDAVLENSDVVEHPHSLVVVVEPIDVPEPR